MSGRQTDHPIDLSALIPEGAKTLGQSPAPETLREVAEKAASKLVGASDLDRALVRNGLVDLGVPANVIDGAIKDLAHNPIAETSVGILFQEIEPWHEEVDGSKLLQQMSQWLQAYVWLPQHAALAITLWAVATWFVDKLYIAPILALLSPTKQCAKTLVLDLLNPIVRRGYMTSADGVTPAVMFRLNDKCRPTFEIDEAEALRRGDRDLIAMLNVGHRRGPRIARCADRGGDFEIVDFDPFGFRVLAAIGTLWPTIIDRGIVIPMSRKPRSENVERFAIRKVEEEGHKLARRIARWVADHLDQFQTAEKSVPRPAELSDRACDNWTALFVIAELAGDDWLKLAKRAAIALSDHSDKDVDLGERLIRDVCRVFEAKGKPEVIRSGILAEELNAIETAPWGSMRGGQGVTAHKLANMFGAFGVKPHQGKTLDGPNVRGYWHADLKPAFDRYLSPPIGRNGDPELLQVLPGKFDNDLRDSKSVTATPSGNTLQNGEKPATTREVTLVTLQQPDLGLFPLDEEYLQAEREGMQVDG